jgi:nucleoside-triphosphatase THEP1
MANQTTQLYDCRRNETKEKITMTPAAGRIAAVVGADSATTQALLAAMVDDWRALGTKVVGVIGEPHGHFDRTCSAGILRDIVSGKPYQIHLEIPPNHTACDIDVAGVETACAAIVNDVLASDLVVLSKFGKLEAMQKGLAAAFEAAIGAGKPVLTTVADRHRNAWQAFAPDAIALPADEAAIQDWWRSVRTR